MKILTFFLCAFGALAAIDGTVINRTTGKPQAGAKVTLFNLAEGMVPVAEVKSGPDGRFVFSQDLAGQGLLQATADGITYNKMLQPGAAATGVELDVYNVSRRPGGARITQHLMLFEPGNGQLTITEVYIFRNEGRTTWSDPDRGTLRFFMPEAAKGIVRVNATAPHGMPLQRTAEKADRAGTYKVDFAIKPGGETRIDLTYLVPLRAGEKYAGKLVNRQGETRLFTPAGVTLSGPGIKEAGQEPSSKANMYEIEGDTYELAFSGTGSLRAGAQAGDGEQDSGPRMEQIMPRLYRGAPWIVALSLAILGMGFALLYRAQPKETDERRRR